jgi:hypothetical protein
MSASFGWLVAGGWCWFVVREKYCWLAGGWSLVLKWCERKALLAGRHLYESCGKFYQLQTWLFGHLLNPSLTCSNFIIFPVFQTCFSGLQHLYFSNVAARPFLLSALYLLNQADLDFVPWNKVGEILLSYNFASWLTLWFELVCEFQVNDDQLCFGLKE